MIKSTFFLLLSFCFVTAQNKLTNPQIINIITKQSMLIERMAKDKICKTNNIDIINAEIELASSVILFEKNINTLKNIKLPLDIHNKIIEIDLLWIGYKKNILEKGKRSDKKIMRFNDIILSECNKVYQQVLKLSKSSNTYPYNFEDKLFINAITDTYDLKHLSQRLALYYTSYFFKIDKYNPTKFKNIIDTIDEKVAKSVKVKYFNIEATEEIDNLEYEWKTIKNLLITSINNQFISVHSSPKPAIIFEKCNNMLRNSDQLSRVYKAISEIN